MSRIYNTGKSYGDVLRGAYFMHGGREFVKRSELHALDVKGKYYKVFAGHITVITEADKKKSEHV